MKKRHTILALLVLLVGAGIAWAGNFPGGQIARLHSLWIQAGDAIYSTTTDVVVGDNDAYINGTLEVDGAARFDGAVTATSSVKVGSLAVTGSKVYRIPIPLGSVMVDGTGPITDSTAPNLATTDNVAAITYDNSGETAEIQFTWVPDANYTAMTVNMICTSSNATGTDNAVDWSIFVHGNDVDIPSATGQTGASLTSTTLDTSEELVTLTLDATGIAAVTAGTSPVTIAVWNASTDNYTLEIKALWIEETRSY